MHVLARAQQPCSCWRS